MSNLAKELASELGCPVRLTYLPTTQEVLAVAQPQPGQEVWVSFQVAPISPPLIDQRFAAMKQILLKELRQQMGQKAAGGGQSPQM